jgi:hypothetical protein
METFLDSIVSKIFDFFKTIAVKNAFIATGVIFSKNFVNNMKQSYGNINPYLHGDRDNFGGLSRHLNCHKFVMCNDNHIQSILIGLRELPSKFLTLQK